MEEKQSCPAAEHEPREREQRHDALEIKPLPAADRERYAQGWSQAQERFADHPDDALHEADRLVTALMSERFPQCGGRGFVGLRGSGSTFVMRPTPGGIEPLREVPKSPENKPPSRRLG
ncbi:hypothetical protein [Streptomyces sp. NPDC018352]|uniref:hypothetical protein n=1 Tax=Streptomyces sp. NPDC018352 TaxID=3157194 RepID=UPI0033CEB268